MESGQVTSEDASVEELVSGIHETAQRALASLDTEGGEATTSDVASNTQHSTSNIRYHLRENLEPEGYVEKVGEVENDNPQLENSSVWALTEKGEAVAPLCENPRSLSELRDMVASLQMYADEREEEVFELRETVEALEAQVTESEAELERVKDRVNQLVTAWNEAGLYEDGGGSS